VLPLSFKAMGGVFFFIKTRRPPEAGGDGKAIKTFLKCPVATENSDQRGKIGTWGTSTKGVPSAMRPKNHAPGLTGVIAPQGTFPVLPSGLGRSSVQQCAAHVSEVPGPGVRMSRLTCKNTNRAMGH
jgi:hypothetical protein